LVNLFRHFPSWIMILVIILGLQAGKSQSGDALLYTDPVRLEIGAGQIGTVRILLTNVHNIYGIDLQASFDPAVVEVVDEDSKQPGVQMAAGEFLKPDFTVHNLAENRAGTFSYVVTQLNPTAPASGKGVILSVQFRGKLRDKSTQLTFTKAVLADRHGNKTAVTTHGAELVVVRPKPSTPTPTSTQDGNFIPAEPTWSPPTGTPITNQPTTQTSPIATQAAPANPRMRRSPGTRGPGYLRAIPGYLSGCFFWSRQAVFRVRCC
jgi:Cohesin domain